MALLRFPKAFLEFVETSSYKKLYPFTKPVSEEWRHILHGMLSKAGFTAFPEIRETYAINSMDGAIAFIKPNSIFFKSGMAINALVAREAGRIALEDSSRAAPLTHRVERFAKFVVGNSPAFADHMDDFIEMMERNEKIFQEKSNIWRNKAGRAGKIIAHLDRAIKTKKFGTLEEQLANLEKPLTEEEMAGFREAIARYNARMAGMEPATPAVHHFPAAAESPPELPASEPLSRTDGPVGSHTKNVINNDLSARRK